MPRHEEEVELLGRGGSRDQALAKGALKLLRAWPGPELLGALIAGCLLSAGFVVLALVPAILAFSQNSNGFCRHNRTVARLLGDVSFAISRPCPLASIFIINLLSKDVLDNDTELYSKYFDEILGEYISSKEKKIIMLRNANSSETKLRYKLSEIPNVNNIDISIDRFFARSIISKGIKRLSSHKVELAAKFQVIWESSGIALEPLTILQLESVKHFINKNKIDKLASIQVDNDLQATTVPCQSFIGFVIRQMTKVTFTDRQSLLKHALMDFCPSSMDCLGIRIIKPFSKGLPKLSCSTIYSLININTRA